MNLAVVGSGISGLATAWLLAPHHHVTLYEADTRLGGHSHTVDVTLDGATAGVDTGFLVHNERTYPNLLALFAALGVQVASSDMSFSVRLERQDHEWCGSNLNTVFAQRANLLRPAFWGMLADILRFNRSTPRLLAATRERDLSLGELLEEEGYGTAFRNAYLLPMGAAIWSSPTRRMLEFPAHAFLSFCNNHGLLQLRDRPQWRTVVGGSRVYVERMAAAIPDVRAATAVRAVTRTEGGVRVATDTTEAMYDQVVLACHSDQSLRLLRDPDPDEAAILGAIRYQPNKAVLHTDTRFLPRRRRAWAAWNYQAERAGPDEGPVSVTYLINRLQPLPFRRPVLVTLNPHRAPADESIVRTTEYAHPVLDTAAHRAQERLQAIQGVRRTWFAGAWTGYGFHEDGLASALKVANALGTIAAWQNAPAPGAV